MKRLFAVVATRQDWSESVVALNRTEAGAVAANKRYAEADKGRKCIRFRIQPMTLTESDVLAIVQTWGAEDAMNGEKREEAERLPEPWRACYLAGWNSVK